jgi:two-component system, chemotaxis family, protein-glutamate methylesterase/glutaminase
MAKDLIRDMASPNPNLLVIGGSAGSLSITLKIIPLLKVEMNLAVIIIFHRKSSDDTTLIDLLSERTAYRVKEAEEKEEILPGVIYLAPPDYHLLVEKDFTLSLDVSEKINYSRPSIDITFESAAEVYGDRLKCLLLSGANADGVEGLQRAKALGSAILVQDPACAEVPYMPQEAINKVKVDLLINNTNLSSIFESNNAPEAG